MTAVTSSKRLGRVLAGVSVSRGERGAERLDRRLEAATLGAADAANAVGQDSDHRRGGDVGRHRDDQLLEVDSAGTQELGADEAYAPERVAGDASRPSGPSRRRPGRAAGRDGRR